MVNHDLYWNPTRDEDGSVIEEQERFADLASNEFLQLQIRNLLNAGGGTCWKDYRTASIPVWQKQERGASSSISPPRLSATENDAISGATTT